MQKLLTKLRFPVIVGSFVIFTWLGTKHFKTIYQEKLIEEKKRLLPDLQQDPKALAKLNELKVKPWER